MTETPSTPFAATLTFTVGEDDTARAVGSGSLPVLGTPRLLSSRCTQPRMLSCKMS